MIPTASFPHQASLETSFVCSATPCILQQQAGVKAKVALEGLDMPGGTPKKLQAPSMCLLHFSLPHHWCGYSQQAVSSRSHIPGASVAFQKYPSVQCPIEVCQQPHARVKMKLIQKKAFSTILSVFSTLQLITGN